MHRIQWVEYNAYSTMHIHTMILPAFSGSWFIDAWPSKYPGKTAQNGDYPVLFMQDVSLHPRWYNPTWVDILQQKWWYRNQTSVLSATSCPLPSTLRCSQTRPWRLYWGSVPAPDTPDSDYSEPHLERKRSWKKCQRLQGQRRTGTVGISHCSEQPDGSLLQTCFATW